MWLYSLSLYLSVSSKNKSIDFCKLILYLAALLNFFYNLYKFLGRIFELSILSHHLKIWDSLIFLYLYPLNVLLLYPSSSTSDTALKRNHYSWHSWCISYFSEIVFCFSPFRMIQVVGFTFIAFIMLRYVSSSSTFLELLIFMHFWFWQKFSCVCWYDHIIFIFKCVYIVY